MNKLEEIKNEILSNKEIISTFSKVKEKELISFHFTLGAYIRNKYLWNKKDNVDYLSKIYKKDNPDEISNEIIKEIYFEIKKDFKKS